MVGLCLVASLLAQDDPAALIESLRTTDRTARAAAREKLVSLGEKAIPALIDALEERDPTLEKRVAELIAKLSHEEFDVREEATEALILIGGRAERYLTAVKSEDEEVKMRLSRALGKINLTRAEETEKAALQKASACEALGALKAKDAEASIRKHVAHAHDAVKLASIEALGAIRAEGATEDLKGVLEKSNDMRMRAASARALGSIATELSRGALAERLKAEANTYVKATIIGALAGVKEEGPARALIEQLESPSPYTRDDAFAALRRTTGLSDVAFVSHLELPENAKAVARFRAWWEETFKKKWE